MAVPTIILQLVERFDDHVDSYRSGNYNETQVRREFIDPFFEALGWDVNNTQGYAEAYKDVIHEDAIKIGGSTKAPDYCFRIGGTRKFFVEAKKPSVKIKTDIPPAYQLRRYGWSAKLPLSILTDFEELAVYDCSVQPDKNDSAGTARLQYITYKEYPERWDEIASVFSREAIPKGSFDKYATTTKGRRGTAEVDAAFLRDIESWREALAKNLVLRNKGITVPELNFSVQRIIDRIIFLRICEDRGIEEYGRLQSLLNGKHTYKRLVELFHRADERYNSGLFHFRKEKNRSEAPDEFSAGLTIDDLTLTPILRRLYYPESPYEFSVLPADILGNVYEQFLGKVIIIGAGRGVKIEEKPEVKKAGGVYYTPTYIVEYIVRNTVGKMLGEAVEYTTKKHPTLRVCDPACGSGSFLLGAYQYLLDWYLARYTADPGTWTKGKNPAIYAVPSGEGYKLTTAERKRIVLDHIFGVDIDGQAVEVTKLSLLLKVLEGETDETISSRLKLFHERALPDMDNNVKCGNSLIGTEFYNSAGEMTPEEFSRVNPFDWHTAFPKAFESGGFDCIIGNPPYGAQIPESQFQYLRNKYGAANNDLDTYCLFIEASCQKCRSNGRMSMIVPTGWYSGASFSSLRRHITCVTNPIQFVNLPYDIFKAWVDTTIYVLEKRIDMLQYPRAESCIISLKTFSKRDSIKSITQFDFGKTTVDILEWLGSGNDEFLTYADTSSIRLIQKINSCSSPFQKFADIQRGVTPFHLTDVPANTNSREAFMGTVRRYKIDRGDKFYIRYDDSLTEFKPERYFKGSRILLRELISRQFQLQAVMVSEDFITNKSMQSLLPLVDGLKLHYLLGILNSKLISWYFLNHSQIAQRDDFPKIVLKETRNLPIRNIDFSNRNNVESYDKINKSVELLLDLQAKLSSTHLPQEKKIIEDRIAVTDREIDRLVYLVYGLTDDEIAIVEGR